MKTLGTPAINEPQYPAFVCINDDTTLGLYIPHLKGAVPSWIVGKDAQSSDGYYTVAKFNQIVLSPINTDFKSKMLVITNIWEL